MTWQYFSKKNDNRFINALGMEIGCNEKNGVWTHMTHQTHEDGDWEVSITTEFDTLRSFSSEFKLESFQKLNALGYTDSWMRYLNGNAEITIEPLELEIPITFKIYKFKTIVFSLDKHFYDEEYRHLAMPEDFEDYFRRKEQLLYKISNRYL